MVTSYELQLHLTGHGLPGFQGLSLSSKTAINNTKAAMPCGIDTCMPGHLSAILVVRYHYLCRGFQVRGR